MKEIPTIRVPLEVACTVRGRPSYRWVSGYVVNGEFPPIRFREAQARAKELGGKLILKDLP
jgi:hypothetical protein